MSLKLQDRGSDPDMRPARPSRESDHLDWKTVAPRWMLLAGLLGLATLAGGLFVRMSDMEGKAQQRLEQAVYDAPTKYQARLGERLAETEANYRTMSKAVESLAAEVKTQTAATQALTWELKQLRIERQRGR